MILHILTIQHKKSSRIYKEYNIRKMDSLTVYMGTLTVVKVKTVDIEYPLQDIALQIAKSSKKLIYMNTLGPKQRDSSSLGNQELKQVTHVDATFYKSIYQ